MYNITKTLEKPINLKYNDCIMITLNFSNKGPYNQRFPLLPRTRLKKCIDNYVEICRNIVEHTTAMEMSIELSHSLNSQGDKHLPRIHSHLITTVNDPIGLLLILGYYANKGCGYHIARITTDKDLQEKKQYIRKDTQLWEKYNKNANKTLNIKYHHMIKRGELEG